MQCNRAVPLCGQSLHRMMKHCIFAVNARPDAQIGAELGAPPRCHGGRGRGSAGCEQLGGRPVPVCPSKGSGSVGHVAILFSIALFDIVLVLVLVLIYAAEVGWSDIACSVW